jgi:CheY-like chemotaxis protein
MLAFKGGEGVEKAKNWKSDAVLCDLGLPEMDGYQVARALRTDPSTRKTWLVAISGYGQEENRRRSRR